MFRDKAYNTLKQMVDTGQIHIVFIFGPPRSGTTAFERQVHEICGGLNINHPELEPDVLDKKISVWENVLNKVSSLDKPTTVVIKTTSDFIAPKEEISAWRDLSEVMFCCFRNPILQMESFLELNLRYLIEDRYERAGGRLYDDNFHINGEPFHSDAGTIVSKKKPLDGNYAGLQNGFRWPLIQWEYDRPELLSGVWKSYCDRLSRDSGARELAKVVRESGVNSIDDLIDHYKNSGPKEFGLFPKFLRDALLDWSFGWTATQSQVSELGKDPKLVLVDFTSAQLDPEGFSRKINGALGKISTPLIPFNIGHENEIAFDGARKHHKLLPPDKKPIPLENFPIWMHKLVEQSLAVYTGLLRDNRLTTSFDKNAFMRATREFKKNGSIISVDQVDPVYAYCQCLDFATEYPQFAGPRIQTIREKYPQMEPYFQMCDRVAGQKREPKR